ncbi:MAG: hypothetical protein K8S56_01615 [Candidatus Cloacimonetes bacterium]|nr:hypothetical protein [Candidatus Cloacimonadota bacterium]
MKKIMILLALGVILLAGCTGKSNYQKTFDHESTPEYVYKQVLGWLETHSERDNGAQIRILTQSEETHIITVKFREPHSNALLEKLWGVYTGTITIEEEEITFEYGVISREPKGALTVQQTEITLKSMEKVTEEMMDSIR